MRTAPERRIRHRRFAPAAVLLALVAAALPGGVAAQETGIPPPVSLQGTRLLHFPSRSLGREFDLYVNLPGNYTDTAGRYPVLYLLDAQWDFPLAASIYGEQYYDGFIPAAIIVGITWGGRHPNHDSLRARDLSPTFNSRIPGSGNGPAFLSFIREEVIPFVDSAFRTTGDRTLMGSSFGGLFTLFALFRETSLFDRYVVTSPYIAWDDESIRSFEREYAETRSDIPVTVFMASGELEEGAAAFNRFAAGLDTMKSPGLRLGVKIIEGAGHSGAKAEGFTRGLQFVFRRADLTIAPALLDDYAGTYEAAPGATITVSVEDGRLVLSMPGSGKTVLHAETERDFYAVGSFVRPHFVRDAAGAVTGARVELYAGERFIRKIR